MLALTIYSDRRGFEILRPEWNALLARSRFNSIFLTWEWQTAWWDCLGQGDLLILAWRNTAGELVGLAPLFRTCTGDACQVGLVGCKDVADYLDIIVAAGHEPEVYSGFLHFMTGADAPGWDEISLCNVHESSQLHRLLPSLAQAHGVQAIVAQEDVAPFIPLPASVDLYLESLDKKQRHEIRRKQRKLERESESWRWFYIREETELAAWVERFIELHRLASPDKEDFMTGDMPAFFHHIARTAARLGWLALSFIEVNGELASTMFNFDYNGRIWVYNSGYNPQAYGHLSPGIVLTSHLIEDAIVSGHQVFDFLKGDEIYKYRFGAVDAAVMRVDVRRESVISSQ